MNYRDATPADAIALADLGRRSFVAKFGTLYTPRDLTNFLADAYDESRLAGDIANPLVRVRLAEQDGALMGYCKLVLACGWPDHVRVPPEKVIELKQLYTDPAATGQGIGGQLMEWAIATGRSCGAGEMQISVWSGNDGGQRFYARYGCEKVADVHFMVGEQRDEEFLYALLL